MNRDTLGAQTMPVMGRTMLGHGRLRVLKLVGFASWGRRRPCPIETAHKWLARRPGCVSRHFWWRQGLGPRMIPGTPIQGMPIKPARPPSICSFLSAARLAADRPSSGEHGRPRADPVLDVSEEIVGRGVAVSPERSGISTVCENACPRRGGGDPLPGTGGRVRRRDLAPAVGFEPTT